MRTSKEYKFEELPEVLTLQLKRFVFDEASGAEKLSKVVLYPEHMVLPQYFMANPRVATSVEERSYSLFSGKYHTHELPASLACPILFLSKHLGFLSYKQVWSDLKPNVLISDNALRSIIGLRPLCL